MATTTKTENTKKATDPKMVEKLRSQIEAIPAELKQGRTWHSIRKDDMVLGYVMFGKSKLQVSLIAANGEEQRFDIASAKDVTNAVALLQNVAERKAAKTAA